LARLSASSQEFSKSLPALKCSQLNSPTSSPLYLACSYCQAELGTRGVIEIDRITIWMDSLCFFSRILQVFVDIKMFTAQFPHEFTTVSGLFRLSGRTRHAGCNRDRSDYDLARLSASSQEFSKSLPALKCSQLNSPTSSPRYLACSYCQPELGTRGVIEIDRIDLDRLSLLLLENSPSLCRH
jgi:hypothetical protein